MKTLRFVGLLLVCALMFGSTAAQQAELSTRRNIEQFTKAIALHPDDADAYLDRGREYVRQTRFDMAVADFTKAIELSTHPYYVSRAMMDRGEAFIAQGNYALAIADFSKILEMKTASVYKAQAHRNRADAHHKNGDDKAALVDIDRAISLSSRSRSPGWKETLAKAYKVRSAIYCRLGDKEAAAADERKQDELGLKVLEKCSSQSAMYPGSRITANHKVELRTGPQPELAAEIATVGNCEDGSRALHDFLVSLSNNPADDGHIIIYTEKSNLGGSHQRERQLRAAMKLFGGSYERVRIVRAALRENAKTEFWRVPPGAVMHETEALDLSGIPESAKPSSPYMYGMESFDGIAECKLYDYDVNSYADHLKQERKDRGRIIIRSTTRTRFLKKQRGILSTLAKDGVGADRVSTVFVRADSGLMSEGVELWVIPAKN